MGSTKDDIEEWSELVKYFFLWAQRGEGGGKLCVKVDEFVGETSYSEAFTWLVSIFK